MKTGAAGRAPNVLDTEGAAGTKALPPKRIEAATTARSVFLGNGMVYLPNGLGPSYGEGE